MSLGTNTSSSRDTRGVASSATRFRERALARRRRPWRRVLVALTAVGVVAALVWLFGWSTVLGVRKVEVMGMEGAQAKAVAERVRGERRVAEVSVRRSWPGTLVVDVVARTPAIVVRNPQGQLEVVDATGVSFAVVKKAPAGVPVVTALGAQGTSRGALKAALALLDELPPELASDVSAVKVSSATLITFTLGARTIVWGGGEEAARKVEILRALLATDAKTIDVSAPDTPVTR